MKYEFIKIKNNLKPGDMLLYSNDFYKFTKFINCYAKIGNHFCKNCKGRMILLDENKNSYEICGISLDFILFKEFITESEFSV